MVEEKIEKKIKVVQVNEILGDIELLKNKIIENSMELYENDEPEPKRESD